MDRPIALVTGASSGIGKAFSLTLANKGFELILVSRSKPRLERVAAAIRTDGGAAHTVAADLSTEEGIAAIEELIARTPRLRLLINNAGFGMGEELAEQDKQYTKQMVRLHVEATTRLTMAALHPFKQARRGSIINVSSVAGFFPMPGSATYAASKSYITIFSESVAMEAQTYGVRVQALCPGFTKTGFFDTPSKANKHTKEDKRLPWMQPAAVVKASLEALKERQVVCIPGVRNRQAKRIGRLIPKRLYYRLARWLHRKT